ncbi:hypothetical protein [Enterobacter hormaechei]|uniref:EF-Tu C-terminal domain-related protein n=1 Tax=Enterobacter hormaechei TaxID=158836 RepID=UPI0022AB0839|nr:hypothetical protein [Enterobacter hormaechei]
MIRRLRCPPQCVSSAASKVYQRQSLIHPIAMDDGLRFAIREGGRTVGAGVVAKVLG